ncbi:hypothetical protein HDU87_004955 [Geranomyces variabilis]|uniref:F-box domain-containing protein n=1 Tax=Geranomyces variabilis TaxID=109894 RepID=A0AAD5THW8_9FUNG|nr:hypothetical protein HDU87_004955 [Geranomyces variabilis]
MPKPSPARPESCLHGGAAAGSAATMARDGGLHNHHVRPSRLSHHHQHPHSTNAAPVSGGGAPIVCAAGLGGLDLSPPTIHAMPAELLSSIFSFLPFADAANSRSVCLRWSQALLDHQYRRVVLPSLWRCKTFLSVIAQLPARAALVHALAIRQAGGYSWLFDRYDLQTAIFALVEQATNLNEFAFDSSLNGPHSMSYSPTAAPPFFLVTVARLLGPQITHLYGHNEGPRDRPDSPIEDTGGGESGGGGALHAQTVAPPILPTAWWAEPRISPEIPTKSGIAFTKSLPNLQHLSFLFTRDWLAGHPGACNMLIYAAPSLQSVEMDFPPNLAALPAFLDAVPERVRRVHFRGEHLWHRGGAVAVLARAGRTIEICAPAEPVPADEWEQRKEVYAQSLLACPRGAVLRVLGDGNVYHNDLIRVSRNSEAFESVEKVIIATDVQALHAQS